MVVSGARAELQCWSAYRAVVREPSRRRSSIYGLGFGCAALCSSGPAGEHATQILLWTSKYMLAWSTNMWFWVRAGDDASCVLLSLCCVARAVPYAFVFARGSLCRVAVATCCGACTSFGRLRQGWVLGDLVRPSFFLGTVQANVVQFDALTWHGRAAVLRVWKLSGCWSFAMCRAALYSVNGP